LFSAISKTTRDILSPSVLWFVIKIGVGSFIFWVGVLTYFWDPFEQFVAKFVAKIPLVGSWEWFQETGAFISALILGYTLIILTISNLTSFLSEDVILKLAKKDYPQIKPVRAGKIHRSIYYTIKASLYFVGMFLLLFPLIFIPVFGQVVMTWLWSILLKEPMIYDVGTLFIEDEKELNIKSKKAWLIAMIASLFNYIPVLNIFAPLYSQILFMHYILTQKLKENR
jgi:uncharacterized protein involved in cysteine biosynthesis